jgi:phosphocarrier protein HPr
MANRNHRHEMSASAVSGTGSSFSREVTVSNKQGIHARPSASFVKLASRFQCDVFIEKDGETINGKSIMGLLMLAAGPGSKLRIVCNGSDGEAALRDLCALVDAKFGED